MNLRTPAFACLVGLVSLHVFASPAAAQPVEAGTPVPFPAASPHPYPTGTGKSPAWSVTVAHPGAAYIAVHFDGFDLGPGDRVVVRSEADDQHFQFTGLGKGNLGAFWATHINGDTAIVELFSPVPHGGAWGVSIDQYVAGNLPLESTEATCGAFDRINAACLNDGLGGDDDLEAYDHSRAVARLLIEGRLLCTGWLVGCEGHLITNEHCFSHPALSGLATAAVNTDYEFMAEAPSCGSFNCSGCHPGAIWGGTAMLVASNAALDYALVHLSGDPHETYGSFFLDDRDAVPDERIYIPGHPGGRAKELGYFSSDPADESGYCEVFSTTEPACTGGPPDVGYFCDTAGGSSGSPVVAYSSHKVVALHHCANCPNRAVPIDEVIADLGADLPACAIVPGVNLRYDAHTMDDSAGNADGIADPGETLALAVELKNNGSLDATGISATLSTPTPQVTVTDPTADWPDLAAESENTSVAPHFTVEIDPSLPCGTLMEFDLTIQANEGVFLESFQQLVGVNVGPSLSRASTDTPLAIPDHDPAGITSSLSVPESFPIGDLNVAVDITHTWAGDLELDLLSPGGATVRLDDGKRGSSNDIVTTYDLLTEPDGPGSMDDFNGEDISGTWQLKIADLARRDLGTLNSWTLMAESVPDFVCSVPPVAVCADRTVPADAACQAEADIDDGSFDPGGGAVTLDQSPAGPYGLGDTSVLLTVTGEGGLTDSCTATVSVVDTVAPEVSVSLSPDTLWPPDHEMVSVDATVTATDNCGAVTVILADATSNEADNAQSGDGNTVDDIQDADAGAGDFQVSLRRERHAQGTGRLYTVAYTATDSAGNAAQGAGFALVPHDQNGITDPLEIQVIENGAGSEVSWTEVPGAQSYDVIRGQLGDIQETGVVIDLGPVVCIVADSMDLSTVGWEDAAVPAAGQVFFYLVAYDDGAIASYGTESASKPRAPGPGNCQ